MPQEIKAIDGLVHIPREINPPSRQHTDGQASVFDLFPGYAERQQRTTPEMLKDMLTRAGVDKAVITMRSDDDEDRDWIMDAMRKFPGSFIMGAPINPVAKGIVNELRRVRDLMRDCQLQLIRVRPYMLGVPCTDARLFPFYSLAIENGLKVHVNIGYPGPAGLARLQTPLFVDELCYTFPELVVIQTHTGHPWMEDAVHNVVKYPNCYLMTNSYRPRHFPPEFIQHLNTRAQDKILWGTEYPTVPFQTSLEDVEALPLREHVRPKYLRENILKLFRF
jgi:hypothetical protein